MADSGFPRISSGLAIVLVTAVTSAEIPELAEQELMQIIKEQD